MITSSFPNEPNDETCGYIRDFARSLASEFDVEVFAPADRNAAEWPGDLFTVTRSKPLLPKSLDPFQASADFNSLRERSFLMKAASAASFAFFLKDAMKRAAHADAICSHWLIPSGLAGALLSRALGKPHIIVEHSGALHYLARMRGGVRLARFIIGGCERVITVSEDLKRKLIALCPDAKSKADVIPMGVDANRSPQKRRGCSEKNYSAPSPRSLGSCGESSLQPRRILFIGRLTEIKGADVLIRAMQAVEGAQLLIAGEGEKRYMLETLARSLAVNAKFLGQVGAEDRDYLLSVCDVVAIPSRVLAGGRTEGTPVVCLEAMAAGKPVIASHAGGLAELIIDGHNGLLVEPDNHKMLREKLNLVLDNARLRETLSRNARLRAASYFWSRSGTRYIKIIKMLL